MDPQAFQIAGSILEEEAQSPNNFAVAPQLGTGGRQTQIGFLFILGQRRARWLYVPIVAILFLPAKVPDGGVGFRVVNVEYLSIWLPHAVNVFPNTIRHQY